MKPIKILTQTVLFLFSCSILISCNGNKLSRGKAKKLIVKLYQLPSSVPVTVFKKYYKSQSSSGWSTALVGGEQYSDNKTKLDELESKGMISVNESVEREGDIAFIYAVVVLTDEGKKYLLKEYSDRFTVKAYAADFGEITGIQANEQFKSAQVQYTLVRKEITPFGIGITQGSDDMTATFSLFDDGWRINH